MSRVSLETIKQALLVLNTRFSRHPALSLHRSPPGKYTLRDDDGNVLTRPMLLHEMADWINGYATALTPKEQAITTAGELRDINGKLKFNGAEITFYLVGHGQEVEIEIDLEGKKLVFNPCNDFSSNDTGALVTKLLMALAAREWEEAANELKAIVREERGE